MDHKYFYFYLNFFFSILKKKKKKKHVFTMNIDSPTKLIYQHSPIDHSTLKQ